ncbi:4787_t:CDS:2 [Rhizophagus irregularis]|nr:4787_t:CDS:2 [Rhizophagus irregularis]
MFELDNIIRLEIINHTNITAISDSDPDSGDSDTDQNFSTVGLNKLDYNYKHHPSLDPSVLRPLKLWKYRSKFPYI